MKSSKRKIPFRNMKTKLDQLCRALVMERDKHACKRCGQPSRGGHKGLQWAHIYSRRYLSVRWDPRNSVALCPGCHLWIHANPLDGAEWVRSWMTAEDREALRDRLKRPVKLDYEGEVLRLRTELAEYGAAPPA